MIKSCVCCTGDRIELTYGGLVRCSNCGHISADISLSDSEMEQLYSSAYFHGKEYGNYVSDKTVLQRNFAARIRDILRFVPNPRQCSLFEIGCAYGFFLDLARQHFHDVQGIDVSDDAVSFARSEMKVDAHAGDFLIEQWRVPPVDIVCLWDTIEHLKSPEAFIEQAAAKLKPGGFLFLTTGDIGSLNARVRKENWRLIHPPTHLHYFNRRSIGELCSRFDMDVVQIRSVGFYRSIGNTLANLLRMRLSPDRLERLAALRWCFYLNLFDIMFVVARKQTRKGVVAQDAGAL